MLLTYGPQRLVKAIPTLAADVKTIFYPSDKDNHKAPDYRLFNAARN